MVSPASWSFFDLPAEIRNRIYRYVAPDEIHIKAGWLQARHRHYLALLYTCRDIAEEFINNIDDHSVIHVHLHNPEDEAAYETLFDLYEWHPLLEKRRGGLRGLRDQKTMLHVPMKDVKRVINDQVIGIDFNTFLGPHTIQCVIML